MSTDLYRLEHHLVKSKLNQDDVAFLLNFQIDDGTYYLDNEMIEEVMNDVPSGIMELYAGGTFKDGLNFIISF